MNKRVVNLAEKIRGLHRFLVLVSLFSLVLSISGLGADPSNINVEKGSDSYSTLEDALIYVNYSAGGSLIKESNVWQKNWNISKFLGTNQLGVADINLYLAKDRLKKDVVFSFYDPTYDRQELVRANSSSTVLWKKPDGYDPQLSFRPVDDISIGSNKLYDASDYIFTAQYQNDYSEDFVFAINSSTGETIFEYSKNNPYSSNTKHGVVKAADLEGDKSYGVLWAINNSLVYLNKEGQEVWSDTIELLSEPITNIELGDLNSDGSQDILIASEAELFVLNASNRYVMMQKYMDVHDVQVNDFTGDGKEEVLVSGQNSITVFGSDGSIEWSYSPSSDIVGVDQGDINGDGVTDLAMVTSGEVVVVDIMNEQLVWQKSISGTGKACEVNDMDNDDIAEVLVSFDYSLHYLEDNSSIVWSESYASYITQILTGDLDGDGVKEIVLGSDHYNKIRNDELPSLYESEIETICEVKLSSDPYWKGLFPVNGVYRLKHQFKEYGVVNYSVYCSKSGFDAQSYNGSLLVTLPTKVNFQKSKDYFDASNNSRYTFTGDYFRRDTWESMNANTSFTLENLDTGDAAVKSCYGKGCSVDFFIGTQEGSDLPGGNYTLQINASNSTNYHLDASNFSVHYLQEPKARENDYLAVGESLFDVERSNESSYTSPWQWLYDFEVASNYTFLYSVWVKNTYKGTMHDVNVWPENYQELFFNNVEYVDGCDTISPNEICEFRFNVTVTDVFNAESDDIFDAKIYWRSNWTNNDDST